MYTVGTRAVFVQSWWDSRLRWDWSDYDGIDTLRVRASRIWKPDLRLYNALVKLLYGVARKGRKGLTLILFFYLFCYFLYIVVFTQNL